MSRSRTSLLIPINNQISTETTILNHVWSDEWGDVQLMDPGDKGYDELYRVGGEDSPNIIHVRPPYPLRPHPSSLVLLYEEYESTIDIPANKGALPHHRPGDFDALLAAQALSRKEFLEPVRWGSEFAYYLYRDNSLDGVLGPGAHFTMELVTDLPTETQVYKSENTYDIDGFTLASTIVSGTTTLEFNKYWETIASGVGFYKDTAYMEEGGYLHIGPNLTGETSVCRITNIVSETEVEVTEVLHNHDLGENIYYWFAKKDRPSGPDNYFLVFPVEEGIDGDTSGDPLGEGSKITESQIYTKGGLDTFTVVESFIPIPWAIPEPYSIRNTPSTSIWLRLDSPGIPFNLSSLVFKVNNDDVTDDSVVSQVTGGIEIYYDPTVDFDLSSRVYIDISLSCSPVTYFTLQDNVPVDYNLITLSGGETGNLQAGGILYIGPNQNGQTQLVELKSVLEDNIVMLEDMTIYEFEAGDTVEFIYNDYPVEIEYYFDIVDDFKPPYFENIYPQNGMQDVQALQWIMFDVKDEGLGIDISTLTLTINNLVVIPDIYKFNDNWYKVIYKPIVPFYYSADVECFATVQDLSVRQNRAYAIWSFSTTAAETPVVMNPDPIFCAYPVHHKDHIALDLYARSGGANLHSMIFTWDQKEYKVLTYPKIYRQS